MIALYVGPPIVCGFVLSWWDTPPQYCERSIWDCVGFYTIHAFLNLLVESQFDSFLKLIISFLILHNTIGVVHANVGQNVTPHNPSLGLFLYHFYIQWACDITSQSTTTQTTNKQHHHGDGACRMPLINVPYKCTFGVPDQGQTLDMWES